MSREGDIEIRLGDEVLSRNYLDDLKVPEEHINETLEKQPGFYVSWSKMASVARVLWERQKQELERYSAQMYTFTRAEKEQQGERTTERQLDAQVRLDPRFQELQMAVLRARLQYEHINSIKEAFAERAHMLMSISANLREEWETSLAIKSNIRDVNRTLQDTVRRGTRTDFRANRMREEAEK